MPKKNTRNKGQIRHSQVPEIQQEKKRKPRVTFHNAKERYLLELEQGAIKKEVAAKKLSNQQSWILPTQEK